MISEHYHDSIFLVAVAKPLTSCPLTVLQHPSEVDCTWIAISYNSDISENPYFPIDAGDE